MKKLCDMSIFIITGSLALGLGLGVLLGHFTLTSTGQSQMAKALQTCYSTGGYGHFSIHHLFKETEIVCLR